MSVTIPIQKVVGPLLHNVFTKPNQQSKINCWFRGLLVAVSGKARVFGIKKFVTKRRISLKKF